MARAHLLFILSVVYEYHLLFWPFANKLRLVIEKSLTLSKV